MLLKCLSSEEIREIDASCSAHLGEYLGYEVHHTDPAVWGHFLVSDML